MITIIFGIEDYCDRDINLNIYYNNTIIYICQKLFKLLPYSTLV